MIAVFNSQQFLSRYPEFSNVDIGTLGAMFFEAGLYLDNSDCSPVQNIAIRTVLLNMLTAHIAFIGGVLSADGQPRPVGRMSMASEGSVSASFEMNLPTAGSGPWFAMSQYGSAFWAATSSLRGMRYIPCPTRY